MAPNARKRSAGASAGYSGTPLAKKLGVKPGYRVALVGAPAGFGDELVGMPEEAHVTNGLRGSRPIDVIVLFAPGRSALKAKLPRAIDRLDQAGGLWIAWPKKSSGVTTDLSDGAVREIGLATGLVDNKVCAINEVWSGLRFVRRLKDRTA